MGQPTMSMQSPQTGGKSGQAPGQSGGKGFGGGGFDPQSSSLTQDMLSNLQQPNNQQADGNNQFGAPLPAMNQAQPMDLGSPTQDIGQMLGNNGMPNQVSGLQAQLMGLGSPGQDMLGSGAGQSTNPYQSNLSQPPSTGSFNPYNLPQSSMTSNLGGSQQNSFQPQMGEQKQMGLGASTQPAGGQGPAGGKGMAGQAANGIQSGMGQGNVTYPSQSGQPMMGMPNQYSNTVGQPGGGMEEGSAYKGTGGGKGAAVQNGKTGA